MPPALSTESIPATDVITELLHTAHAIGATPTGFAQVNHAAYALLGNLRYADCAVAGEVASGSFKATVNDSPLVKHGTFIIHTANPNAKSITITITVGGVKVTITIRS